MARSLIFLLLSSVISSPLLADSVPLLNGYNVRVEMKFPKKIEDVGAFEYFMVKLCQISSTGEVAKCAELPNSVKNSRYPSMIQPIEERNRHYFDVSLFDVAVEWLKLIDDDYEIDLVVFLVDNHKDPQKFYLKQRLNLLDKKVGETNAIEFANEQYEQSMSDCSFWCHYTKVINVDLTISQELGPSQYEGQINPPKQLYRPLAINGLNDRSIDITDVTLLDLLQMETLYFMNPEHSIWKELSNPSGLALKRDLDGENLNAQLRVYRTGIDDYEKVQEMDANELVLAQAEAYLYRSQDVSLILSQEEARMNAMGITESNDPQRAYYRLMMRQQRLQAVGNSLSNMAGIIGGFGRALEDTLR